MTVRYAGWNTNHQVLSKNDACYVSDTNSPVKYFAQGIDHNYNIGYVDIWLGLKRASRENSMIVLSGHKIDRQYQDYITHESKLIFLLKQCKRKNIDFYLPVMDRKQGN